MMRIIFGLLCLALIPGSAWAEPATDPDFAWQTQDWQQYGQARQIGSQLVLWSKSRQGYRQGLALLLPDWQRVGQMLPLSRRLNQLGFDTLVMLPSPEQQQLDPANERDQAAIQSFRQTWGQQLTELERNVGDSSGYRLMLAQGSSAVWLGSLLSGQDQPPPDALILLDAFYPAQDANEILASDLAATAFPILDLYPAHSNGLLTQAARQRQLASRRANKLDWRQQRYLNEQQLARQIKGWLTHLGWQ